MARRKDKGFLAEDFTERALKTLQEEGSILGYIKARTGFELDSCGIDFLIHLKNGLFLPLQVKWSEKGIQKHLKAHPDIKWVIGINKFIEESKLPEYEITLSVSQAPKNEKESLEAICKNIKTMCNCAIKSTDLI